MAIQSLYKEVKDQAFSTTFTTGDTEVTERVLVKRIPLSTYFGSEPGEFYAKYSMRGTIDIDVNVTVKNSNVVVEQTEYIYESDGATLASRNPKYEDVILVYVTIKVPVKTGTIESSQGYYHIDFNPTPGHKHSIASDGFEQFIPAYIGAASIVKSEVDNRELLVKPMNIYMRPVRIRDNNNNNKVIEGTERTTVLYHTDQDFWFNNQDVRYDPTMLRLGKVVMHANSSMKDNMTILDTRTRGGGLDESITRKVIKDINDESLFNWDIGYFDGEAYQENGVVIIKLPTTLREKYGDNYQSIVNEVVAKHKAYGVLPIVEFYNPEDITAERFALLPNHNFLHGQHISYYDPKLSTYDTITKSKEGYMVKLPAGEKYVFKLPSYRIEGLNKIQIKPYVKRYSVTQALMAKVTIHYHDAVLGDSTKDILFNTDNLTILNWHEFDFIVNLYDGITEEQKKDLSITHVDVTLFGPMDVDYVLVKAYEEYSYSNMEVIEL